MKNTIVAGLVVVFLSGCASSHINKISFVPTSDPSQARYEISIVVDDSLGGVPDKFVLKNREYLELILGRKNMLADATSPATRKVTITIIGFSMPSDFSRYMLGALRMKKDSVESTVVTRDVATGEVIGESAVSAYNLLGDGTSKFAKRHAYEILQILIGSKG